MYYFTPRCGRRWLFYEQMKNLLKFTRLLLLQANRSLTAFEPRWPTKRITSTKTLATRRSTQSPDCIRTRLIYSASSHATRMVTALTCRKVLKPSLKVRTTDIRCFIFVWYFVLKTLVSTFRGRFFVSTIKSILDNRWKNQTHMHSSTIFIHSILE